MEKNKKDTLIFTYGDLIDFTMYVVNEKPLKAYNDMSREVYEKVLNKWVNNRKVRNGKK